MSHSAPRHILGTFDAALNALQNNVLMMASLTERNLHNAMSCLLKRDDDLCNVSIADDEEVDQLEKRIDQDGIDLLRRFQPVASDLRQVVAAMKVSGNLERIADQAVNIARKARKLNHAPALEEIHRLDPMFSEAMSMLHDSLHAYSDGDAELARTIKPRDRAVDAMAKELAEIVTTQMQNSPERITDYLNVIFIARHIERVGDHAKNIAEDAVYVAAAEDIRHSHAQ